MDRGAFGARPEAIVIMAIFASSAGQPYAAVRSVLAEASYARNAPAAKRKKGEQRPNRRDGDDARASNSGGYGVILTPSQIPDNPWPDAK